MIEQSLIEWLEEGKKKFGEDIKNWKFKCPACGRINSVQEFIDLGTTANDAYVNCIGRFNGHGVSGMIGEDQGFGCDWAAYGLFGTLCKGRKVITDIKEVEVFDFADSEMEEK